MKIAGTLSIVAFLAICFALDYKATQRRAAITDAFAVSFSHGFLVGYERAVSNWQSPPLQTIKEQLSIELTNFLSRPNITNLINSL